MDLRGWLWTLGLQQYEAVFRENHIDETILPNLTAEDLKDLGVGSVGHRRKLLDAIAAVFAEAPSEAPPIVKVPAKDPAERRHSAPSSTFTCAHAACIPYASAAR